MNRIKQRNDVVTLEEDVILTANEEVPIDEELVDTLVENEATLPFSQWNMDAINLPDSLSLSGDNVKVAVLDSGISTSEYLSVSEYVDLTDSGNENPLFNDGTGHGTSIASVIATSDLGGMYGIAPNAELYDVKVLDGDNSAPLSKIIEGIYWCIDNDIDIINMSLGKGTDNPYTDKSDFFPNRFTAAKAGVANLFKRYENENSFSVSKFYIETGFSKKLNNFNGYLESAGQSKVADEYSTANYRVDAPGGNISGNEKNYVDYGRPFQVLCKLKKLI